MGFKIPEYLQRYLSDAKWRKPFENFVNNSSYYTGINYYWINYMTQVVRPAIAYSCDVVDGVHNQALSLSTGKAIVDGATKLVKGKKIYYEGNNESCSFLSDIWTQATNFNITLNKAIRFMLQGGTSVLKINTDAKGRNTLSTSRIDRAIFSTNEEGNVNECVLFITALSSLTKAEEETNYWLVEHRYYNDKFEPCIQYKVFAKSGISQSQTLPSPYTKGLGYKYLPKSIKRELFNLGVGERVNTEMLLPYSDGLGVWLLRRTSANSCVPDAPLGDPLLYGLLDLLWSMDVVYSGSMIDVLNGEGKILVPKQFLAETVARLQKTYGANNIQITTEELNEGKDESFVYIKVDAFDKEKHAPTPVQFDIRSEQYRAMLEMYEKEAAVRCGFSPTSLFPHLTPDSSAKTATEVTAEENMTRATVEEIHSLIVPIINRALREVLRQEGLPDDVTIKLSDYIGNKIQFDANLRENYKAGLIPKKIAVQLVNDLSVSETEKYLEMLEEDGQNNLLFNDSNYFGGLNDSKGQTELAGGDIGRGGDQDTFDSEGRLFETLTPPSSYGTSGKSNPRVGKTNSNMAT